ncbi:hypothetical protein Scep_023959 [Stephania cephalantha]|uniref:Tf2-1-like SH3-like domain-containing protein n=1 Tax=Stephania cephalantha TaxID=152367 RepID=A0AAP0HXY0_9MAGN
MKDKRNMRISITRVRAMKRATWFIEGFTMEGPAEIWDLKEIGAEIHRTIRVAARVGGGPYRLDLPAELAGVHPTFHISMLRLAKSGPRPMVDLRQIEVRPDVTYEERPIAIVDRAIQTLRNREIPKVLVRW